MTNQSDVVISKATAAADLTGLDAGATMAQEAYMGWVEDGFLAAYARALKVGVETDPQTPVVIFKTPA